VNKGKSKGRKGGKRNWNGGRKIEEEGEGENQVGQKLG